MMTAELPAPLCFSCGNALPVDDYELFHKLVEEYVYEGMDENAAQKIVLDGKLSKIYHRVCCRIMFIGDPYEYRKKMGLYNGIPFSSVSL